MLEKIFLERIKYTIIFSFPTFLNCAFIMLRLAFGFWPTHTRKVVVKSILEYFSIDGILYHSFNKLCYIWHKETCTSGAIDAAIYFDEEGPEALWKAVVIEYRDDLCFRRVTLRQSWKLKKVQLVYIDWSFHADTASICLTFFRAKGA